jgi:uncharacterized protein YkwD
MGARLTVAALCALMLTGCTTSDPASLPTAPVDLGDPGAYATALYEETNARREAAGLAALTWSECLAEAARPRAIAQLGLDQLSHGPLTELCTEGVTAGENLSRYWGSAEDVVAMWLDSPAHKANLLNPAFTASGIACVPYAFDDTARIAEDDDEVGGMACSQLFEGD